MDEETPSLTRKRDLMKQISMMREDESSTDEVHPTETPISRVETVKKTNRTMRIQANVSDRSLYRSIRKLTRQCGFVMKALKAP